MCTPCTNSVHNLETQVASIVRRSNIFARQLSRLQLSRLPMAPPPGAWGPGAIYILQRGVQWKQGVVICMVLYTIWLYNTTPIHCTPLRLHPPLMKTQARRPARICLTDGDRGERVVIQFLCGGSVAISPATSLTNNLHFKTQFYVHPSVTIFVKFARAVLKL